MLVSPLSRATDTAKLAGFPDAEHDVDLMLKVGVGGIDALTGEAFDPRRVTVDPQDYLIIPNQP